MWVSPAAQFVPSYLAGLVLENQTSPDTTLLKRGAIDPSIYAASTPLRTPLTRRTAAGHAMPQDTAKAEEDCLFLDVFTPKQVFDGTYGKKAPVLGKSVSKNNYVE